MSKIKIYKASAGSGKTYTLAKEYIKELLVAESDYNYRHILAVTFTKDATGEMLDRILAELYGLAFNTEESQGFINSIISTLKLEKISLSEEQIRTRAQKLLNNILHDYSRLSITTIDSFFQKILRNLARELGKGSKYNLEMNTNKTLQEAVRLTIEKANTDKRLLNWLTTYIEHKLEDDKAWRIEKEIFEFSKCIYNEFFQENEQLLKTQLSENPNIFVDINKQQQQIKQECKQIFERNYQKVKDILEQNALTTNDFKKKSNPIDFFKNLAEGNYSPSITPTLLNYREEVEAWTTKTNKRRLEIYSLVENHLIHLFNENFETLHQLWTTELITGNLHQLGLIWDIAKIIDERNSEENRFMLSDTAMFLNQMIDKSDAPFIYEKISSDIKHVMIDEFQDTSRLQWSNFKALLSEIIANDKFSLIVGDVKQSIYRWRNGDWKILSTVDKELDATTETLANNFRSAGNIISFNNDFFVKAAEALNTQFTEQFNNSSIQSPFLSTYKEDDVKQNIVKHKDEGYAAVHFLNFKEYSKLVKEEVFNQIQTLYNNGVNANDICILTRTNNDIKNIADYLSSIKNEYPELAENNYLNIISNDAFELQSAPAIKIIIEVLKTIAKPDDVISKEQLLYFLGEFNISLPENFNDIISQTLYIPLYELIGYIYQSFNLSIIENQSAYLFAFYDSISKYLNDKPSDINNFLQYWDDELKYKTISAGASVSGIKAMTIHKSKGLQFHTVIIPYCKWSINPKYDQTIWCKQKEDVYSLAMLPVGYNNKMADTVFAEEYVEETVQSWFDNLNILYVAFTRAEHNLIVIATYSKEVKGISSAANLLQSFINNTSLNGEWNDEDKVFSFGKINPSKNKTDKSSDNPFLTQPKAYATKFISSALTTDKPIFKQSNKSREFVLQTEENKYISHGNIMHKLFEQITHIDDLNSIIDSFVTEGLIPYNEKEIIQSSVLSAIKESNNEHWFNGSYKSYPEYTILLEENGEVVSKRPDRVLFSDTETIVIDYKFGKERKSHKKQVEEYMQILRDMKYINVKGYIWYVEEGDIISV
ncbi:ATP-dependent helicase/nuclease subunit A [Dysgonomonadaceae bacterium PH5-43]|nr:ATP-dependent helicase/nuclease subunit A [Dysgonomonadaceae bacterium PH5-43]